jgi:hypothetical protein
MEKIINNANFNDLDLETSDDFKKVEDGDIDSLFDNISEDDLLAELAREDTLDMLDDDNKESEDIPDEELNGQMEFEGFDNDDILAELDDDNCIDGF